MIKITILGNNSALPAFNRHPTAQVIDIREQLFLMDCGEGTQSQITRYSIHWGRISHIFISHLHGDHYFGLIGLLSSMSLWNRQKPVTVYGPPALEKIIHLQLDCVDAKLSFPLTFHPILPDFSGIIVDTPHLSVSCFPVSHGIPCHGFLFKEKSSGRKINPEACREFEIPQAYFPKLKQGEDYQNKQGQIIKNDWVTLDAPPDKTYAFCADTLYDPDILPFIRKVNLLYHESTFLKDNEERAKQRHHSTAEQAAQIARQAGVDELLIGHYSSRYEDLLPFETEAKSIFPNTKASVEGICYTVS